MAKITNHELLAWFGDRDNRKQMFVAIPGGSENNTGGVVFL